MAQNLAEAGFANTLFQIGTTINNCVKTATINNKGSAYL